MHDGTQHEKQNAPLDGLSEDLNIFNWNKDEIYNVLGMAKDGTIIYFRLFKWFFTEFNQINVRVHSMINIVDKNNKWSNSRIYDQK